MNQNEQISKHLDEAADLLEHQQANRFRVAAYRRAAETVRNLPRDVGVLLDVEGFNGLTDLPNIGPAIGGAIVKIVRSGVWAQLERLRGSLDAEELFSRVPGVGRVLAKSIADGLHIDSLEALEQAAHDGSLERLRGFGKRRTAIIQSGLASLLTRPRPVRSADPQVEPSVELLLDVDCEYRDKAQAGKLRKIAPRRFNPLNEAWLPILHTHRGNWQFTILFSNTALAHQLARNHDWVVIVYNTDSVAEGQRTVVTEVHGPLRGRRVVRGRERECQSYYDALQHGLWATA